MKLSVLGSGTSVPSKNRGNSGYVLETEKETILIDGGAGAIRKLPLLGLSIWDITKIFYSHLHIDHTQDLVPLLFAYKNGAEKLFSPHKVEIYAHNDFANYFKSLQELYGHWIMSDNIKTVFTPVLNSFLHFDSFSVQTAQVSHTPQSIAYRFESKKGKSLLYSGDTDYCNELVSLSSNCSVMLVECSFPDELECPGHMTPEKASRLIEESQPERVILTHIYPENDDRSLIKRVKKRTGISIELAEDMLQIFI